MTNQIIRVKEAFVFPLHIFHLFQITEKRLNRQGSLQTVIKNLIDTHFIKLRKIIIKLIRQVER